MDTRRADELQERLEKFARDVLEYAELKTGRSPRSTLDQLVRSGTSAGANYRSARRARSTAEFAAKLGVALEEVDEAAYWLTLLRKPADSGVDTEAKLLQEACELRAILAKSHRTVRLRLRARTQVPRASSKR